MVGAKSGATAVAPGVLETGAISFGSGDGRVVFNHTSMGYVFDAAMVSAAGMVGNGRVQALAGRTVFSADHSGFTGALEMYGGGILQVNGNVPGASVDVQAAGTLEGKGTVGDTVNAGIIASGVPPGASFETLTVDGNYTGSTGALEIDVALGDETSATDRLVVTGDTLADATLLHVRNQGVRAPSPQATAFLWCR